MKDYFIRFKQVLEEKQVKQGELAKLLGNTQSAVSAAIASGDLAKVDYYLGICELTGANLLWLLQGKGEPYGDIGLQIESLNAEVDTLKNYVRELQEKNDVMKKLITLLEEKLN